ncbi:MAG TPA: efflux RND transporter permease subunit [Thermoanaerobaculia bacterium]|nr:efflux RND transporter permease subunit [Thermoanaerobaculia bacterium]
MSLPRIAARRPVGTAMIYLCVVVLGIVAARRLPVDLMPEVDMPRISVTTTYEGVAPAEMETLVTRPIEQTLSTIEGIDKIEATSAEGISRVQLQFAWGVDLDEAVNDVREQLDRLRNRLPEDADTPSIWKFNLSDFPVAFLGLSGGGDARRLRYLAEESLSRQLERVPGVAAVSVRGGRQREVQVQLDPARLSALGVTPRQVTQSLARENRNVSAGDMQQTGREVLIRTVGEYQRPEEVAATVVAMRDGRAITVADLGDVVDTYRELTNELWIDGAPGIRVSVNKRSGANTVEVVAALRREVEQINRDYAGRLNLQMLWTGSDFIQKSVSNVKAGAFYGAFLAVAVLLLFLRDVRATLIIGTAIPISVLASIALMYFNGFSLNLISLGGIALGVGMLVDGAIVVLENIYRKRNERLGKLEAAVEGSREVAMAILAGTLTTIAVFLPVVFIPGFAGVFFKEMAVVVCFALFCALAVALSLIPAASARILEPQGHGRSRFSRWLQGTGGWLGRLDRWYATRLSHALAHPWRIVALSVALLGGSLLLVPLLGFELMPETDEGRIDVNVEMPVGTPVQTTMGVMLGLEQRLRAAVPPEALDHVITTAGPESWWRPASGNTGAMQLMLVPVSEREVSSAEVAGQLRRAFAQVPGADIQVRESSSNILMRLLRGGGDRLVVEVRGHDLETADRLGKRVLGVMAEVPGVVGPRVDREEGKLERTLHVDRSRLAELGLTGADVAEAVEHYVLGRVATRLRQGGEEIDIRVQLPEAARAQVEQLGGLPIVAADGRRVSLSAVATIEERRGPSSIARENQERLLRVSAGIADRPLGDVVADLQQALGGIEVPEGFTVGLGGELVEQRKVFGDLLVGILLALFLVYTVMAVQFESLLHPLIIMTAVPFSFIGVVLALAVTGTTFSMNAFLGAIVLVGIVVNNAIVLVDYVNLLRREQGLPLERALVEAGRRRLRPILMTTLSTALGMLPLAIGLGEGGEIQAPLARVVVGGLLTSSAITLLFVPSLYLLVERLRLRRRDLAEQPVAAMAFEDEPAAAAR